MIPGDGSFVPYTGSDGGANSDDLRSPTNGRVFVLKFASSSQRHFYWLQSKSQAPDGSLNWFSPRDQKLGQIIDILLSGENLDVDYEIEELRNMGSDRDDDDDPMEDVEGSGQNTTRPRQGSGGAGAGATGGDIREEGEEAREGGADGGRA
jgi:26S proteasome regulatory subunit N13